MLSLPSTETNYWNIFLSNASNRRYGVDVVGQNFAKDFDSVPHNRLLLKLKCIGINGQLLNWRISFFYIKENNEFVMRHCVSDWKYI